MTTTRPIAKPEYLSGIYQTEIHYINKIILFQDYHFRSNGEIILLIDTDFPGFGNLTDQKIQELIFIYEFSGWKIKSEKLKDRNEWIFILS